MKKNKNILIILLFLIGIVAMLSYNSFNNLDCSKISKLLNDKYLVLPIENESKENDIEEIKVIGDISINEIKELSSKIRNKTNNKTYKILFVKNNKYNLDEFYDENMIGEVLINGECNLKYFTKEEIFESSEVRNFFEVVDIKEKNKKMYVNIKVNGDKPSNLISESKLVSEHIRDINNISEEIEIITSIDTNSVDYEISSKHKYIVLNIEKF